MLKKFFLSLMAVAAISLGFVSCSDDDDDDDKISLSVSASTAAVGKSVTITVSPSDASLSITSGSDFATLSGTTLSGKAEGKVVVTAEKDGLESASVEVEFNFSSLYNDYWGTWSLMGTDYPMWAGVTETTFSWAAKGYGTTKTEYEYVKWTTDDDGNAVVYGYPSEERYTADNPAASLTFGESVLFDVPSMKNNAYVQNYTSATLTAGKEYDNSYEGYASYWGKYTGSLTVMNTDYDITVTIANGSFAYSSTKMSGEYTYIKWAATTFGRTVTKWTLSGYADGDSEQATEKVIFEVDLSGESPAYTFTVNVDAMGTPSATLTKSE